MFSYFTKTNIVSDLIINKKALQKLLFKSSKTKLKWDVLEDILKSKDQLMNKLFKMIVLFSAFTRNCDQINKFN